MDKKLECYFICSNFDWINENWINPGSLINVIVVIATIFIPFAIEYLTNITKGAENRLDKKILVKKSKEIFPIKTFFISSVLAVFLLSLLTEKVPCEAKIIAAISTFILAGFQFWWFYKTLEFQDTYEKEFIRYKIEYFTALSKQTEGNDLVEDWRLLWEEEFLQKEDEFTKLFITQINEMLKNKKYDAINSLIEKYYGEINKRGVSNFKPLLPALADWMKNPTLKKTTFTLFCESSRLFLLETKNDESPFKLLREYVDYLFDTAKELESDDLTKQAEDDIEKFFTDSVFSERNIPDSAPEKYRDTYKIPSQWKVCKDTEHGYDIARAICSAYVSWFRQIDEKKIEEQRQHWYWHLTWVHVSLFKGLDLEIFDFFLNRIISSNYMFGATKPSDVVGKKINNKESHRETSFRHIAHDTNGTQKNITRNITAEIILNCFGDWQPLFILRRELDEKDRAAWGSPEYISIRYDAELPEHQDKIRKKIVVKKLEDIKTQLDPSKYDEKSDQKLYCDRYLDLINLLIAKINENSSQKNSTTNTDTP